jgi:hypothetical protein
VGIGPCCSYCPGSGKCHRAGCWRDKYFASCCYMRESQGTATWPAASPVSGTWHAGSGTIPAKTINFDSNNDATKLMGIFSRGPGINHSNSQNNE